MRKSRPTIHEVSAETVISKVKNENVHRIQHETFNMKNPTSVSSRTRQRNPFSQWRPSGPPHHPCV